MIELATYRDMPLNSADIILQSDLLESLLNIELRFGESHLGGKSRVAAFDLDNTLLIGDIGDAVYAQLLSDGFPLPLSWLDYQQMIKEDPKKAYMEAVKALDGIPLEYLVRTTKRVLQSKDDMILCEGSEVVIPKPNHLMYELVRLLHQWQYTIFVISASNDISAKIAGSMIFDIPANNIAGIKPGISDGKIVGKIQDPVPFGEGKVAQYRRISGNVIPMVVATDSESDLPMLQMCDPDGLAILVGESHNLYTKAKNQLPTSIRIQRVITNPVSFLQQQYCVA